MSSSLCFTPLASFKPINKPGVTGNCNVRKVQWMSDAGSSSKDAKLRSSEIRVTERSGNPIPPTKPNSLVCAGCEGNGAIQCTQCEGKGVNLTDHFNGRFKAGGLCWLCRGKREILCGNCNGAGFIGGIMSTMEE